MAKCRADKPLSSVITTSIIFVFHLAFPRGGGSKNVPPLTQKDVNLKRLAKESTGVRETFWNKPPVVCRAGNGGGVNRGPGGAGGPCVGPVQRDTGNGGGIFVGGGGMYGLQSSAHGWSRPFFERIPSKFRANSEFRANSGQIPSNFRANSEQASQTLCFLVILCNESPWLADTLALGVKPTMRGT